MLESDLHPQFPCQGSGFTPKATRMRPGLMLGSIVCFHPHARAQTAPSTRTAGEPGQGQAGAQDPRRRLQELLSPHKGSSHGGDSSPDRNVNSCARNCVPPRISRAVAYNLHVPQTGFSEIS